MTTRPGDSDPVVITPQADGSFLVRGGDLACARLLALLRAATLRLRAEDVIHLETTDPVAPIDLPAWCRLTGHHYMGRISDHAPPTYGIKVGNDPRPTSSRSPWRPT